MKTIEQFPIWKNGVTKQAGVLNARGIAEMSVKTAMFWYCIYEIKEDGFIGEILSEGNLHMTTEEYDKWEDDSIAWDWIASKMNFTITGDYILPTTNVK